MNACIHGEPSLIPCVPPHPLQFAIVCEKREYVFKAEDQNECDKIVKNLLELRGRELPMSPITPH